MIPVLSVFYQPVAGHVEGGEDVRIQHHADQGSEHVEEVRDEVEEWLKYVQEPFVPGVEGVGKDD